ncbi:unnamed protein product, partial [Mesorhabditis belari]|uniref:Uncharacterized protein n=1 Tax=Mesorhabditis belari TaxID=2138241 RepID=A0AAF3F8X4_9BILA
MLKVFLFLCIVALLESAIFSRKSHKNLPESWMKLLNSKPELKKIYIELSRKFGSREARAFASVIQAPSNPLIPFKVPKNKQNSRLNRQDQSFTQLANPLYRFRIANYYYKRIRDHYDVLFHHLSSPMFGAMPARLNNEIETNEVLDSNDDNSVSFNNDRPQRRSTTNVNSGLNFGTSENRYWYDYGN